MRQSRNSIIFATKSDKTHIMKRLLSAYLFLSSALHLMAQSSVAAYTDSLPQPLLRYAMARLEGEIIGYKQEMGNELELMLDGVLTYTTFERERVKISPEGRFTYEVKVATPTLVNLYKLPLFDYNDMLCPGDTLRVTFDVTQGNVAYGARTASNSPWQPICHALYYKENEGFGSMSFMEEQQMVQKSTPQQYRDTVLTRLAQQTQRLQTSKYNPAVRQAMAVEIKKEAAEALAEASSTLRFALKQKAVPAEEGSALLAPWYEAEKQDNWIPDSLLSIYNDLRHLPLISNEDIASVGEYLQKRQNTMPVLKQLFTAFALENMLQQFKVLNDTLMELAKQEMPKAFHQQIHEGNEQLKVKLQQAKGDDVARVQEAGEAVSDSLFADIIARYKGRTLLVDFWATWCGPCRQAHRMMEPMKAELKDSVTYLYLTGENSPQADWENMITTIKGEHFRLSQEQWEHLCSQFNIAAIPYYIIVNPRSEITYRSTSFRGVEIIKQELLNAR